ncbi:phage holin family protein [Oryzibacter oryziterrae]|uniref:phage holin family protein n=1 Tax=Oryzibacter oryziterrae TaxID=2766474 RepID=UPI001F1C4F09|nr:phage holin family protein [Oryzibacter oryziterrae]
MNAAIRQAANAACASLGHDLRSGARHAGWSLAIATTVLLCSIAAAGCALVALWIAMLPLVGPWIAPLIVSSALLLIAAAGLLVLTKRALKAPAPVATKRPNDELLSSFQDNKVLFLLAALLAGFTSAQRQDHRKG